MGYGRWRNPNTGVMMGGYPPHPISQRRTVRWYASWGGPTHSTTFIIPWSVLDEDRNTVEYWLKNAISTKYGINRGDIRILEVER